MKKLLILCLLVAFVIACGENKSPDTNDNNPVTSSTSEDKKAGENPAYDPNRGEGKFKNVEIAPSLDVAKAESGNKVYGVKCSGCHKTTDEKLVGPGWAGVTTRHTPDWIMNFITNTDAMIDKDPKVQAQLEICLIRMPNQNLSDEDARNLYEFMRKNDGVK